ncbi:hypothetical protein FHX15_005546 [Rhizobium sp. BK650]|nr:hypothetical protein [Rhizobium sp. BK650]
MTESSGAQAIVEDVFRKVAEAGLAGPEQQEWV